MNSPMMTSNRITRPAISAHHPAHNVGEEASELAFTVFQDEALQILGSLASLTVALEDSRPLFHEAGAYFPGVAEDSVFVTSNILTDEGDAQHEILIHRLVRPKYAGARWRRELIPNGHVVMGNGGIPTPDGKGTLFCAQGNRENAGGLVYMSKSAPFHTRVVLPSFFGRWYNSVNDVVYASDGSIYFTDPTYGYEQGFRPRPRLPCQVYRYDPVRQDVRVLADGLQRPNGLCFSPDEKTLYVTDTDWIHGDGSRDERRARTIYAFTLHILNGSPFLTHKRLFAFADTGVPDGIKCDTQGNVYSGCGDGVSVWNPQGVLLFKIRVPGGVANFCFGAPGEVLMLNETRFVVATLSDHVTSAYRYPADGA